MLHLLLVGEDRGHLRLGTGLVDRVLSEEGPAWLTELMDSSPEAARSWRAHDGLAYFDLHKIDELCKKHDARLLHGHFTGEPGAAGAQMARNVFLLARHLIQRGHQLDAVVLLWDMDGKAAERRRGLEQARAEARALRSVDIALGCPDHEGEAWVLAGFEPQTDQEREALARLTRELGFSPVKDSHRLHAARDHEPRSVKRVLEVLTSGEQERAQQCWRLTSLATLEERGEHNGLRDFLKELREVLLPRVGAARRG